MRKIICTLYVHNMVSLGLSWREYIAVYRGYRFLAPQGYEDYAI